MRQRLFVKLYRAVLRLAPEPFQRRFGAEALEVAVQRVAQRRRWIRAGTAVRELVDLALTVRRERWAALAAEADARRAAAGRRGFAGPDRTRMGSDLRFTLRALTRSPWYSTTVVGVVAVTLALATTVFAIVDGVLFRPLPYPAAARLATIEPGFRNIPSVPNADGVRPIRSASQADIANWQAAVPEAKITGYSAARAAEIGPGVNEDTAGIAEIQPNFFDVIGVHPLFGGFDAGDFEARPLLQPVVATYAVWQSRFGGAPDVIGRTIVVDATRNAGLRIVGVMPQDFVFPSTRAAVDFLSPFVPNPVTAVNPKTRAFTEILARLPGSMSTDILTERLQPALAATAAMFPPIGAAPQGWSEREWLTQGPYDAVTVTPLHERLGVRYGSMFRAVFAAVILLVLIGAANVSSLMTARSLERGRELQLRRALGATRGAIVRLWLAEALGLFAIGTALAVAMAPLLIRLIVPLLPDTVVLLKPATVDWRVVGFSSLMMLGLAGLVSVAPIRRSLNPPRGGPAKAGTSERVRTPWRFVVIGGQISAGFVLTVVGACLVGSLAAVYSNDVPIDTREVVLIEGRLRGPGGIRTQVAERTARASRLAEQIERQPHVTRAAFVDAQVLRGGGASWGFLLPAGVKRPANLGRWSVSPGFFDILGLKPLEGRVPTNEELLAGAPVLVVDERVARALWPTSPAVGQTLIDASTKEPFTVIGVVPNVPWAAFDQESATAYAPYVRTTSWNLLVFFLKTNGGSGVATAEALRAMADTDSLVRPSKAAPLDDVFRDSVTMRRFQSWLFGGFAAAALIVIGTGILGLLAMSTARRTREIGIRCALGATPRLVTRLLIREQAIAVLAGLTVGVVIAAWAVGLVKTYMYGISVFDPRVWAAAIGLTLVTAGLGAMLPAIRASRRDPLEALRAE